MPKKYIRIDKAVEGLAAHFLANPASFILAIIGFIITQAIPNPAAELLRFLLENTPDGQLTSGIKLVGAIILILVEVEVYFEIIKFLEGIYKESRLWVGS